MSKINQETDIKNCTTYKLRFPLLEITAKNFAYLKFANFCKFVSGIKKILNG